MVVRMHLHDAQISKSQKPNSGLKTNCLLTATIGFAEPHALKRGQQGTLCVMVQMYAKAKGKSPRIPNSIIRITKRIASLSVAFPMCLYSVNIAVSDGGQCHPLLPRYSPAAVSHPSYHQLPQAHRARCNVTSGSVFCC